MLPAHGTVVLGLAACALLFASCAFATSTSGRNTLDSQVDHEVMLGGRLQGPGKIASGYLLVDGQSVYLEEDGIGIPPLDFGTEVVVRGMLRHYVAPANSRRYDDYQQSADYYFVESPQLTPAPSRTPPKIPSPDARP